MDTHLSRIPVASSTQQKKRKLCRNGQNMRLKRKYFIKTLLNKRNKQLILLKRNKVQFNLTTCSPLKGKTDIWFFVES